MKILLLLKDIYSVCLVPIDTYPEIVMEMYFHCYHWECNYVTLSREVEPVVNVLFLDFVMIHWLQ